MPGKMIFMVPAKMHARALAQTEAQLALLLLLQFILSGRQQLCCIAGALIGPGSRTHTVSIYLVPPAGNRSLQILLQPNVDAGRGYTNSTAEELQLKWVLYQENMLNEVK